MTDADGTRLLVLPARLATARESSALVDVRSHVAPDGVWIPGPARVPRAPARVGKFFDVPVVHPPLGGRDGPVARHDFESVSIVTAQRASALSAAADALESIATGVDDRPRRFVLVCDDVGTTVNRTTLETTLDHAPALADCVPSNRSALTVLSARLPAGYDRCWLATRADGSIHDVREPVDAASGPADIDPARVYLRVRGIGPVDDYSDAGTVVSLDFAGDERDRDDERTGDGRAERPANQHTWPIRSVTSIGTDAFGVRAVDGVGAKTAEALADRGISSREALLETTVDELASCPGIGQKSAHRLRQHARVIETGQARRLTTASIPGADDVDPPLCLDIETDGLSPTIVWQVGVYDPKTDDHHAFLERSDPSDPGRVLESFLEWLLGTCPERTLLTWNGWRFDYRHLASFVGRYVPQYLDEWHAVSKRDLYHWAITEGNASLPGRTNALEDVADALGYAGADTGLDGAATAAAYSRFVRTGDPLEWERHGRYCEDDCRALWAVYEHLAEAPVTTDDPTPAGQTGLGDF